VIGLSVVAAIASALFSDVQSGHGGIIWIVLVVAAPVVALRRLMQHRKVTAGTLLGAVSVYLLIALAATYFFLFIDTFLMGSGRFFGQEEPTTVFAYFSLITITTVGYGDFDPVGEFGRAAAAWEAVIGQIYLVVVVARLVSLYSGGRLFRGGADSRSDD
jgi:cobalamin synthase